MKSSPQNTADLPAEDGRFTALMFMQSIHDHGSAMTGDDAGKALIDVFAELASRATNDSDEDRAARIEGFVGYLGEALWWHANGRILNREQTTKVMLDAFRAGFLGEPPEKGGA